MYRVYLHPAPSHRALEHRERLLKARYAPMGACLFCSQRKTHNPQTKEHTGKNMPTICYGQSEINENTANV